MSDEYDLQLQLLEERYNNAIQRLEGRLSEIAGDLRNYRSQHESEHRHYDKELDLKIELLRKEIESLSLQIEHMEKEEEKTLNAKTLDWTKIGVWVATVTFIVMAIVQIFDIKVSSDLLKRSAEERIQK